MRLTTCGSYKFLTNPLDTYVGKSLEIYGEWSQGELNIISSLVHKNANILEVGSNIGAHTVFIAKEICPEGNVYAFEPRRVLFQNLCANLCINEISNVYTFQKALGSGLIDHNQKMTVAAMQMADMKVCAHRS